MSIKIVVEQDEALVEKAGNALDQMVARRGNKPLLMLLSGGSSLDLLEYIEDDSLQGGITFGMLDDRYSKDSNVNSYHIVERKSFYLRAIRKGAVFLDSSVYDDESLETYAERYESYVKKWIKLYPNGIIRATVGIGPDGHTSGILPMPEDPQSFEKMFNGEKLVVGYDVGNKNPHRYRMTSTFTLMKKFDKVLTYMKGGNKKDALQRVVAETGSLAETPGRIIKELDSVELYTDIRL